MKNQEAELASQLQADVAAQRVARVYAESLIKAAEKQGAADEVLDELQSLIQDVFSREPLFETFLASSAINLSDEVIDAIEAVHRAQPNPCP